MSSVFRRYAEIYDAIYSNKEYVSESAYVLDLVDGLSDKTLLDIGCGTGRYSEIFAQSANAVTGIDISDEMIEIANGRKRNLPKDLQSKIQYQVGDACTFESPITFDVVCSMFHVINYQTSNSNLEAFFDTAYNALKPSGQLVFDFWYGPGVLFDKPSTRVIEVNTSGYEIERKATPKLRINDNCVDVTYDLRVQYQDESKELVSFTETHSMRYLFVPELEFFSRNKFKIEHVYAWRTRNDPRESDWSAVCTMRRI